VLVVHVALFFLSDIYLSPHYLDIRRHHFPSALAIDNLSLKLAFKSQTRPNKHIKLTQRKSLPKQAILSDSVLLHNEPAACPL
jgi:hypothetical protein